MPEIDLPTVIFALVALFVAYKLRSVLGTRQDASGPAACSPPCAARRARRPPGRRSRTPAPPAPAPPPAADRWKGVAEPDPAVWSGLDAIAAADRGFYAASLPVRRARRLRDGRPRLRRRRSATLRSLMAPEAFANFDTAIRARAAAGQTMTTTVVSIDDATIVGAQLVGSTAQLSVRFATKLASVTRDAAGAVVDGSPNDGRRPSRPVDLRARRPLARSQLAADGDRVGERRAAR